jgi:class 3 adenylate cyclase
MGDAGSSDAAAGEATSVRTFLIADLRGYTRYSDEHGDEAASALARRFAAIASDAVSARSGKLIELRGDEALCVFASARSAVRGAVELQRRAREPVEGEPALPLGVGIGLDADYLREHHDAAAAYAEVKRGLAALAPDIDRYAKAKDPTCDLIYLAAWKWASEQGWTP